MPEALEPRALLSAAVVGAAGDGVVSVNDTYSIYEDVPLSVPAGTGVLANDAGGAATLTAELVPGPEQGVLVLNPDGSFEFEPALNFNGTTSFTYRVTDGVGGEALGTAAITVIPVNDEPSAGTSYTIMQAGGSITFHLPGLDADGDTITYSVRDWPQHGTLTLTPEGQFTYKPFDGFTGSDGFSYNLFDGTAYNIGADVLPPRFEVLVEPAPGATPQVLTESLKGYQGTPILGTVETEEFGGSAGVRFKVSAKPANGKVKVFRDGSFRYKARKRFTGADSFRVRATNGVFTTESTIDVTVLPTLTWAAPTQDFIRYDSPAGYYASEQFAYVASDGASQRSLSHFGVIVVLREGATFDVLVGGALDADLIVVGTPSIDFIALGRTAGGRVTVEFNWRSLGSFAVTGAVRVYGLGERDTLSADGVIPNLELYGGGGDDFLTGSDGPDLLCGGAGGDSLRGGAGDDVLVGGVDSDALIGGAGEDVLVGGSTTYDLGAAAPPETAAAREPKRSALLAAWAGPGLFADRVAALSAAGGLLAADVLVDDANPDQPFVGVDALTGGDGPNWFIAGAARDTADDRRTDEPLAA